MRKDERRNLHKIIVCLARTDWLWIREISRRTGLHHKTVSRLINKYPKHFEVDEKMKLEIPTIKIKLVRLK